MTTPTLSELADIGAKAAQVCLLDEGDGTSKIVVRADHSCYTADAQAREAFAKAVLDAVGYKFPVDPEREAFERWLARQGADNKPDLFSVWQAGKASHTTTEPAKQPETFDALGHTWFKHTPGDPMPVDGEAVVQLLTSVGGLSRSWGTISVAKKIGWDASNIVGWRYTNADS